MTMGHSIEVRIRFGHRKHYEKETVNGTMFPAYTTHVVGISTDRSEADCVSAARWKSPRNVVRRFELLDVELRVEVGKRLQAEGYDVSPSTDARPYVIVRDAKKPQLKPRTLTIELPDW